MFRLAEQRKNLFVSGAIQGRILVRLLLYWCLYHFFLIHALFITSAAFVSGIDESFWGSYRSFMQSNLMLIGCAVVSLPVILRDMLRLTNRVAGPFVQFERALKDMAAGQVIEPIQLRHGDLVGKFIDVFNDFIKYHNTELERKACEPQAVSAPPAEVRSESLAEELAAANA
jgi:hypothetical protein